MNKQKSVAFRIELEKYELLKQKAAKENVNIGEYLRDLVYADLEEKTPTELTVKNMNKLLRTMKELGFTIDTNQKEDG